MSNIVSVIEAKDNLMNKDFCKLDNEETFYHRKEPSVHISEKKMREILRMRANDLEERFSPFKIRYINFKKLMTCSWSREKYNNVLDAYKKDNNLLSILS